MTSIPVNTDASGYEILKQHGITPTAAMAWLGPWTNVNADGTVPQLDQHQAWCKARGITPVYQFYYWGDSISLDALKGTATPKGKTIADWWKLAKAVASRLKESGGLAYVIIETEFNKNHVMDEPAVFDKAFRDMAWTIKGIAPEVKVVSSPGSWADPRGLYEKLPGVRQTVDIPGTQFMRGVVREGARVYDATDEDAILYFERLRTIFPDKPLMLTDLALSTYGGAYSSTPPFGGGSGGAEEARQASVLQSLAAAKPKLASLGVSMMFYREVKNNHSRDPPKVNYYGYAEGHFGVIRDDGTEKPGFAALKALAAPSPTPPPQPGPAPETVPKVDYDRIATELAGATARALKAEGKLTSIRQVLDA